jgi:hydrogenase maturation protease
MKALIFGFGNPILGDDGVGLRVARELGSRISNIDVKEGAIAGLSILDEIQGYDKLIIIDSIMTKSGIPGHVYKINVDDLKCAFHLSSSHEADLLTSIEIGREMGYDMPDKIEIYGIEIRRNDEFSEELSSDISSRISNITDEILRESFLEVVEDKTCEGNEIYAE